ncbi:MAG: hypothetical protein IJR13_09035 [Bacteroidales bacterium]|nr:hypothetical protein [Bacteroidales bacterium]
MSKYVYILLLPLLLWSCEAEFSPNAEWREVPSVFCLLDQDDTVSYVRVQKCYLGNDDLKSYATIFDSTNYAEGDISVHLLAWRSEDEMNSPDAVPVRTLVFDYAMLSDKTEGIFSSPMQPVYKHRNEDGDLDTAFIYQLVVAKAATGEVLASATTSLVGDAPREPWLTSPNPVSSRLGFHRNRSCQLTWLPFARGRRYQATVRYHYRCRYQRPDSLRHIDMSLPVLAASSNDAAVSTSLAMSTFLANVETSLHGDTATKLYVDTAVIFLSVCNEPLHAYLNSIELMNSSLDQEYAAYSNIEGGVGIFAARRTALRDTVLADNSDVRPYGLHFLLEQLDVGFGR